MAGWVQSGVAPPFDSLRSLRAGHAGRDRKTGLVGTAEEAAEKCNSGTSGAKARIENRAFIAALKRCSTQNPAFFRSL